MAAVLHCLHFSCCLLHRRWQLHVNHACICYIVFNDVLLNETLCSTQSGRLCVVLPASQQGPPKGILLGTSPGMITRFTRMPKRHVVSVQDQVIQETVM